MAEDWSAEVEELARRRKLAEAMGGPEKLERQRQNGRLNVRERIAALVDSGSFEEVGSIAGSAAYSEDDLELEEFTPANFIAGLARIDGRRVAIGADDFTVRGGAADASIAAKQIWAEEAARELEVPLVRLVEGTGGGGSVRTIETDGYTYVPVNPGWDAVVDNLSLVPVIGACMGPVAGLGAARAVHSHLCILVRDKAQLFVAGPPVVLHATGADLDKEELGGARVHEKSGAVERVVDSEEEAFALIRAFLDFLPQNVHGLPQPRPSEDDPERREESLLSAIPRNRRAVYKLRPILDAVFDRGSVLDYAGYGDSVYTGLARLDGHPVGVAATDPYKGAAMTAEGAEALTRLVDLCETFHLPLVSLTDQAGVVIGLAAEKRGTIRHGVRAISAVYQARIPYAEVILRRNFGVGGAGITNRHVLGRRWAWPSADWGSLPVEGGIEAAYKSDLAKAEDPEAMLEDIRARLEKYRTPFRTAERFGVEELIDPRETRPLLCEWVRDAYALLPKLTGPPSFGTRP
jgi:acetyl-CoA carboxylase carboxyltransferase component